MSTITIQTGEIDTYQGDESDPLLRIFVSKNFVASDGDTIMRSSPNAGDFYKEVPCTAVANVVTYPQFTIDSTLDAISNPRDAKYQFDLFTADGEHIQNVFKNQRVPVTTPTTLGALAAYNEANANPPADAGYSIAQTNAAIAAAVADKISGDGIANIAVTTSAPTGLSVGDVWLDTDN